ncbi:MAG: aminotransferase class I/II-fold pyridoxal phosphate-dependent enzyme [Thalassotalea sp.]
MAFNFIGEQLASQQQQHRYRQTHCVTAADGQHLVIDGKHYLNFSSNDYLGLNQHAEIAKAFQQGADEGLCATGSNLITGYHKSHRALEDEICTWLNQEACLLFTSGFSANAGCLQALANKDVNFFLDKLSHASLIDGAFNSKAVTKRFLHNDISSLTRLFKQHPEGDKLIVSEGVFSMDGDLAPIDEMAKLATDKNAWLYLDDAHSLGVIGDQGQGSSHFATPDIVMATFGKAVATSGAFIAGTKELKEYLTNFCRHYIYTTAMSPALAKATQVSIKLIQKEQWRRDKIKALSEHFIQQLDCPLQVLPSDSSIHALVVGDEEQALAVAQKAKAAGIWLTAIRPPTVPKGTSRLRVTICANHNVNDINVLSEFLNKVMN